MTRRRFRTSPHRMIGVMTPLTFMCGLIAVVYFFYRAALVAVPAISLEQSWFHSIGDPSIVCGLEDSSNLNDPEPLLSLKYQDRIRSQAATPNMIPNPDLTQSDSVSTLPIGYSQNTENTDSRFEYLQEADGRLFLRASALADNVTTAPSWLMDAVAVEKEKTYAYSFLYRSDAPVAVTLEQIKNGVSTYRHIIKLSPANSWQSFAAHFYNSDDVDKFRIVLTATGKGYVDSRNLAVYQIPDAFLAKGVVTVAFDDGWSSVKKKALPLLKKYAIRTTQYIISEVSRQNVKEYMTMDDLKALKREGHEIGSHSLTHCDQTSLNDAQLKDNAMRSKPLLEQNALGTVHSFAYPFGQYNAKTQAAYAQAYQYIRTPDAG